jgi:hypothetical protein
MWTTLKSKLWGILVYLNEVYDGSVGLPGFFWSTVGLGALTVLTMMFLKTGIAVIIVILVTRFFYLLKKVKTVE